MFESRAHPRTEKVLYLVHLNDCRKKAQFDMKSNITQLDEAITYVKTLVSPEPSFLEEHIESLNRLSVGLHYIVCELESCGRSIDELRSEVSWIHC